MPLDTAFRSEERFTQDEFFDWLLERPSGDIHHYELLGGRIVMTPPANVPHGAIGARICAALVQYCDATDAGRVYDSSQGFDLPTGDTVEPDVAFVSAAKLAVAPKPGPKQFFPVIPDLVVEILSPSTARRDRTEKKRIYEKNSVSEYWIVSHEPRQVTVFCLADGAYGKPIHVVSGFVESRALAGLRVALSDIFRGAD